MSEDLGSSLIPLTEPGAPTRSGVVRKPRYRRLAWLRFHAKKMELWLDLYRVSGNVDQACKEANLGHAVIYDWAKKSSAFKTRWDEIKEMRKSLIEDKITGLVPDALDAFEEVLKDKSPEHVRYRVDVATKLLKGAGHLSGEPATDPAQGVRKNSGVVNAPPPLDMEKQDGVFQVAEGEGK